MTRPAIVIHRFSNALIRLGVPVAPYNAGNTGSNMCVHQANGICGIFASKKIRAGEVSERQLSLAPTSLAPSTCSEVNLASVKSAFQNFAY